MRISQRLYLTMVPAVLGLLLMAALAYWGQYARTAPTVIIVAGGFAVIASFVLTWSNARYVTRRIERLASASPSPAHDRLPPAHAEAHDEIDQIENVMHRLSSAVELAEATETERESRLEQRAHDYAVLITSIADASMERLEQVRLPLHILLENRFGELNENQEEMLGAARTAAESVDADLLGLREIAELDSGARPLRKDPMKISEVMDALRALLVATGQLEARTVEMEIAPLLPRIVGDRARLQNALSVLFRDAIANAPTQAPVRIHADQVGNFIAIVGRGVGQPPVTIPWAAAVRVVQAHRGTVERRDDSLSITLPVAGT